MGLTDIVNGIKRKIAPYLFAGAALFAGCDEETGTTTPDPNNPPTLASIVDQNAKENQNIRVPITASDLDGDLLEYSLDNAPDGMHINSWPRPD